MCKYDLAAKMEVQVDKAAKAVVITSGLGIGDYVLLTERQENGEFVDVLYQFIKSSGGKRGLLRASCLTKDDGKKLYKVFDEDSNIYAKSSLGKFVADWAGRQNFDAFVKEVSLLELPRADDSDEAAKENSNYIRSLRLSNNLSPFWTKTATADASSVWCASAHNSTGSVHTSNAYDFEGVVPVLWLKFGVWISGGEGTCENPHYVMLE